MQLIPFTSTHYFARKILWVSCAISLLPFCLVAQLPTIELDTYSPTIRDQIARAYQTAQANPRAAAAIGQLGMVLQAYNESAPAAACFARARVLAPKNLRWSYFAALAQISLGNQAQAVELLRQSIQLKADYWPAKMQLADLLFTLNQPQEAETLYREVTKYNPNSPWAWYGLGRIQAVQHDVTAAITSFERALALSPQFGLAHYALAMALRDAGQQSQAKEHLVLYQQHSAVRPARQDALLNEIMALNLSAHEYLNQGLAREAEGDLKASVLAHEKALTVNPYFLQAHINLIQLYGRLGQPEQAEKSYRSALQINPNAADAHYNFGVVLLSEKKLAEAKTAFTNALAGNPHYAEAAYNLGLLLMQETRFPEAISYFRTALIGNPNLRTARFELGRLLVQQGNLTEALAQFQQTLRPEDASTPRYLYALAATYVRAGKRAEGMLWLQRARQAAATYAQKELLASIERDLKTLEEHK